MLSGLLSGRKTEMVGVSDITLEKLRLFTDRTNRLITIDAPLFGSIMVFNGRVFYRGGSYVEPEKIGTSIGFPTHEQILSEASRFWILDEMGVRRLKCREEMAELLKKFQPRTTRSNARSASVQPAASG
jgi:hypothetical protein